MRLVLRLRPLAFATFLVWRLLIGACSVGACGFWRSWQLPPTSTRRVPIRVPIHSPTKVRLTQTFYYITETFTSANFSSSRMHKKRRIFQRGASPPAFGADRRRRRRRRTAHLPPWRGTHSGGGGRGAGGPFAQRWRMAPGPPRDQGPGTRGPGNHYPHAEARSVHNTATKPHCNFLR